MDSDERLKTMIEEARQRREEVLDGMVATFRQQLTEILGGELMDLLTMTFNHGKVNFTFDLPATRHGNPQGERRDAPVASFERAGYAWSIHRWTDLAEHPSPHQRRWAMSGAKTGDSIGSRGTPGFTTRDDFLLILDNIGGIEPKQEAQ